MPQETTPRAIDIVREVAKEHEVHIDLLRSKKHPQKLRPIRAIVYKRLRAETALSYAQIGLLMGGRHYSSIVHSVDEQRREKVIRKIRRHRFKDIDHGNATVPDSASGQSSEGLQIEREAERGSRRRLSEKEIDEIAFGEAKDRSA